jgi:hypothetical protein
MKNACTNWKDQLLEAALTGVVADDLAAHMSKCATCGNDLMELRARRGRLDSLLPLIANGAEPSVEFRARVLAAADAAGEGTRGGPWRIWQRAVATAAIVAALATGLTLYRRAARTVPQTDLVTAQKLADWRAPSDVLLQTLGREILWETPRFGESYLHLPAKTNKEE